MIKITRVLLILNFAATVMAIPARAQQLADQTLVRFPAETVRIEYAKGSELRELPEYSQLRKHFLGPRLQAMDASLGDLGIKDADIYEIAIGWRLIERAAGSASNQEAGAGGDSPGGSERPEWPMAIFGMLNGRFDARQIAEGASAHHIPRVRLDGREAFCPGAKAAEICLMALDDALAIFGDRESLGLLLEVQEGRRGNLGAERRFTSLVHVANRGAALWGIATGPSIADGLLAWTPGREQMPFRWTKLFDGVRAMTYRAEVGEQIHATIRLECESAELARLLSGMLQGLQGVQSLLWQTQSSAQTNPLADMQISSDGNLCLLKLLTTSKSLLESPLAARSARD